MSFQEFPQTCRTTGSQQLYNIILAQYFSVFEVSHILSRFDLEKILLRYSKFDNTKLHNKELRVAELLIRIYAAYKL